MTVNSSRWGAKIGPRLAVLMAEGVVYAHNKMHTIKHRLAMAIFHSISDEISEEVDITLGPILKMLHDQTPEDHPAYPAVHFLHTATGQLKALAGTGLQVSGLLGSIAAIMNNELAPVVFDVIRSNPHLIPSLGDAANMAAAGVINPDEVNGIANANGYDNGWAKAYAELARNYPTLETGLELLRRGLVDNNDVQLMMQRAGVPEQYWGQLLTLRNNPVSVADAALAVLRGNITANQGASIAAQSGVTEDDFGIIIDNTGEPPGLEQLLEGYRRGFIDQATLKHGILQSRYRDEWIPLLEKLRYAPLTVSDAVNAVVQNHLAMNQGEAIAQQNGLEPGSFKTLYETAGEPLSRTEMEELYNRGLATEADVLQALSESRLKNKYGKQAFALHTKLPPIVTIQRAVRYGGLSHADAVKAAMELGYSQSSAAMIVSAGSAERLQSYKDRVVSATQALHEGNIISPETARGIIQGLNYTQSEAEFIIQASEFHREARVIDSVVSAVKTKYLQRHITANKAKGLLDSAGIPAAQRDHLMSLWEVEHGAYTRVLTEAQIIKAVKLELISADDGLARLVAMGYAADDAALLIGGA